MCACMCECVYVSASGRSSSRTAALSFVCSSFTLARSCANSADEALAARGASLARSASGPSAASTLSRSISFSSIPAGPRVEGWAAIRTKGQGRGLWLRLWSRSISHSHLGTNLSPGEIQRPSSSSRAAFCFLSRALSCLSACKGGEGMCGCIRRETTNQAAGSANVREGVEVASCGLRLTAVVVCGGASSSG